MKKIGSSGFEVVNSPIGCFLLFLNVNFCLMKGKDIISENASTKFVQPNNKVRKINFPLLF